MAEHHDAIVPGIDDHRTNQLVKRGTSPQMKRLQKGFTLIELMIVIAIIAILAAILIPNFLHARAESQTAACEGNEKQIATALEEYAVDHSGNYPASGEPFAKLGGAGNVYMAAQPFEPVDSTAYVYTTPAIATCTGGGTNYSINDDGKHDATVKIANTAIGAVSVIYCSGSGITGK
jgi:prepilin-type N-terminal cleavage/methylation domain-containing protein